MRKLLIALVLLINPALSTAQEPMRRLTLTGIGQVFVAPDMAVVNLGVRSFNKQASVAMQTNSAAMAQVFDSLKAAGIAPRDIQTTQLSLNPRWERRKSDNNQPHIIGYEALNTVTVRVRALETVGTILDVLTRAGANQINNISFAIQKPRPHQDEARRLAVADAQSKAALYVAAAGVSLGQIISIVENSHYPQPRRVARMSMAAETVPVAEGELALQSAVSMVFEIK